MRKLSEKHWLAVVLLAVLMAIMDKCPASEAAKTCRNGMKWYNNGSVETYSFECPEGFVLGRLTKEERRKREFNAIANSWLGYNAEYDKKNKEVNNL